MTFGFASQLGNPGSGQGYFFGIREAKMAQDRIFFENFSLPLVIISPKLTCQRP
jgi:hypothetical protein